MSNELPPPPTKISLFDMSWRRWLERLYNYMVENVNHQDPLLNHAIDVIAKQYGHKVSVREKGKDLLKFGHSEQIGTTRGTIMDLPSGTLNESYVTTNAITTISSSASGDSSLTLTVEGHTISGGNLTFSTQNVVLDATNAQTQVTLTTALARATRIYVTGSTLATGTIYVYENDTSTAGVPDTASKVHIMISAGEQQSQKASTSISSTDYWIVTGFYSDVIDKAGSPLVSTRLEKRIGTDVFLPVNDRGSSNASGQDHNYNPYQIIRPNSDVRLTAVSSAANTEVTGGIQGYLAVIT